MFVKNWKINNESPMPDTLTPGRMIMSAFLTFRPSDI